MSTTAGSGGQRRAGRRGRRPVKPPGQRFNIQYISSYVTAALPTPKYPVDVSGNITDWGMLGNGPDPSVTNQGPNFEGVGDCTFAGRQHYEMAKAKAGGETAPSETANSLVAEYLKYDHGQDQGANIADLLLSWYQAKKIEAFAPVDHTNPAECDAAMAAFNGLYVGVNLTSDADQLFEEGKPWTVAHGERPNPQEGHCIVKVKADGNQTDGWVTWGALQESTTEWSTACLDEAWVIIAPQDAASASIDLAALKADIDALHGTGN